MNEPEQPSVKILQCTNCGGQYLDIPVSKYIKKCPSCGTNSKKAFRVKASQQSAALLKPALKNPASPFSPFDQRMLGEMEEQTKFIKAATWGVFAIWVLFFVSYLIGFRVILPGG